MRTRLSVHEAAGVAIAVAWASAFFFGLAWTSAPPPRALMPPAETGRADFYAQRIDLAGTGAKPVKIGELFVFYKPSVDGDALRVEAAYRPLCGFEKSRWGIAATLSTALSAASASEPRQVIQPTAFAACGQPVSGGSTVWEFKTPADEAARLVEIGVEVTPNQNGFLTFPANFIWNNGTRPAEAQSGKLTFPIAPIATQDFRLFDFSTGPTVTNISAILSALTSVIAVILGIGTLWSLWGEAPPIIIPWRALLPKKRYRKRRITRPAPLGLPAPPKQIPMLTDTRVAFQADGLVPMTQPERSHLAPDNQNNIGDLRSARP